MNWKFSRFYIKMTNLSKKPFKNIMVKNFQLVKHHLKSYLYYNSICDSINPIYRIPILDYSTKYSLSDFYLLKFMDFNISSDQGLYDVLTELSFKKSW